jgi:hypothetical protein
MILFPPDFRMNRQRRIDLAERGSRYNRKLLNVPLNRSTIRKSRFYEGSQVRTGVQARKVDDTVFTRVPH